jgi:hypothetical protein
VTNEEKQIVKDMSKLICEMTLKQVVFQTLVMKHVPDWPAELASLISSPEHKTLEQNNLRLQQSIELLVDKNNLTSLRLLLSKGGQEN